MFHCAYAQVFWCKYVYQFLRYVYHLRSERSVLLIDSALNRSVQKRVNWKQTGPNQSLVWFFSFSVTFHNNYHLNAALEYTLFDALIRRQISDAKHILRTHKHICTKAYIETKWTVTLFKQIVSTVLIMISIPKSKKHVYRRYYMTCFQLVKQNNQMFHLVSIYHV